jgi:hypothetical protein
MSEADRRFAEFDALNPMVWTLFQRFTNELIAAGFSHYSADAVLHRVRWETAVGMQHQGFKLNNNFTPYYARKYHQKYPNHAGFFRLRRSLADGKFPELDLFERIES